MSYQKELPPARINIHLNLESHGGKIKQELPFKILVLGGYTAGKQKPPLESRQRLTITQENFDAVLKGLAPTLTVPLNNTPINLSIQSLHDFHPDALLKMVPSLKKALAIRRILKELKTQIMARPELRRELDRKISDKKSRQDFFTTLQESSPISTEDISSAWCHREEEHD